jgi:hypothetical protein
LVMSVDPQEGNLNEGPGIRIPSRKAILPVAAHLRKGSSERLV